MYPRAFVSGKIPTSMNPLDAERERQRLALVYANLTDEELQKLAADAGSLSAPALPALADEVRRRALDVELAESAAPQGGVEHRDLVVIRRLLDLPDALLAQGALNSAGIECFLVDDNMVRLDWLISNMLGGVKLAVKREDVPAAEQILNQPMPDAEVEEEEP